MSTVARDDGRSAVQIAASIGTNTTLLVDMAEQAVNSGDAAIMIRRGRIRGIDVREGEEGSIHSIPRYRYMPMGGAL